MTSSDALEHAAANGSGSSPNRKFISAGDLVIIFMSRDKAPVPVTVTPGQETGNAYGIFSHDEMIGLPFGAKVSDLGVAQTFHLLNVIL